MSLADIILSQSETEIINLLESNPSLDVNESDHYGFRPLIEAILSNKFLVFQKLLANPKIDLEQQDIIGRSPLQWACERNSLKFVRLLLEKGANPNHYALDGQPLIAAPLLREDIELINLLKKYGANIQFGQDYVHAKLLGHRFELTGQAEIVNPNNSLININLEGFYLEFTCGLIGQSLNSYINSIPGQKKYKNYQHNLLPIIRALNRAAKLLTFTKHKDLQIFDAEITDLINDEEYLIIPFGYRGHAISFIKYLNLFAKCDRGVNNFVDTVVISKLGNQFKLNTEFIKELLYKSKPAKFIDNELKDYLKLTTVNTLPTANQIAGNCSWANIEASVPALLFMLLWKITYDQPVNTNPLKREVMNFYSDWVNWDQDTALDETLAKFYSSELNSARQLSFGFLLTQILVQRLQATNSNHINRANKIVKALTSVPKFYFILKDLRKVYNKSNAKFAGENLNKLLKACEFDLTELKSTNLKHQPKTSQAISLELHRASFYGELEKINFLIKSQNLDINARDRSGSTALMYAAWNNKISAVELLLQLGADPLIINYKNGSALNYAKYRGNNEIIQLLKN